MTNPMILQLKIEREKVKKNLDEATLKMTRLLQELVAKVNPYFTDITEIDAVSIEQIGDELLECKEKITGLTAKLDKITKDLD